MELTNKQAWMTALVAGITVYFCEWLELITPGFCGQGLQFTFMRMYVFPLLLSVGIGYLGYKTPVVCWLLFMMPSSSLKMFSLFLTGGNLAPPVFALEIVILILTGIIIGGVAKIRSRVLSRFSRSEGR